MLAEDLFDAQARIVVLESITDAFVAVDSQFRYLWVNAEAERLLQKSSSQLLGRCVWDVFPEMVAAGMDSRYRTAVAEGKAAEFETYYAPWDRWFFNKLYPTNDGGLAIHWREITAQKKAEADLRRQALVLGQVQDSLIMTDMEGTVTNWNHGAQRMFGYSEEEMVGRSVMDLFFEEDQAHVTGHLRETLLRDGQMQTEVRKRRKSGEECYVRLSLSLLRDEAGKPYGTLGVSVDITAQRSAEIALRESEARYRSLVDAMPQIAYVTNANGAIETVNRHWEDYFGISAGECAGFDWVSRVHPENRQAAREMQVECLRTGAPFDLEYRASNARGEYRWHLSRAVAVRNARGDVTNWVGTLTDIDHRKRTEETLRDSEERFRLASQAVEGIIYDWDARTGVVQRIGNLEKLIGIPLEQAVPTALWWQQRIHPEDRDASGLSLMPSLKENNFETEFRLRHADGHWVTVCDRGFIIRDEHGKAVRVAGSTHDISERKRLEKELRFQADILATTNDAVIALDANRCVSYCNAGAERMYGFRMAEAIGKPLTELYQYSWLHPEDEQKAAAELATQGTWKGENRHTLPDGTEMIVNSTVNVLSPEMGGGLVSVIRDISKRKRAEIAAQKQAAQVARVNEDLLHFAYAVSHDLQAPLRTVTSYAQLLALTSKAKLDEQSASFLTWIIESGARMTTMLRDLLQFAAIAGNEARPDDTVSLDDAVATALENLRSVIEETQAAITCDPLPEVEGDANQLTQVFQNLIGNSLKYRKPETAPWVHISAERKGDEWVMVVRDNGIGFDAQYATRIFGVFQRLHDAEVPGTGIGLAICKRIVERRGGQIWAASQAGEGAAFSFSIPVSQPEFTIPTGRAADVPVEKWPVLQEGQAVDAPFDELFHTLNLAQAFVRKLDGTILIWTQGAKRLFGWSESEAVGRRAHDLLRKALPKPLAEIEARLLREGEWTGEVQAKKRDGTNIWVACYWALYRDGSGRPQSVIEVHNDITALKEAEASLVQSGEQRDLALRAGQMGVWQWDRATGSVWWDSTIEGLHGMKPGTFEGTLEAFEQRVHPDDRGLVRQRIAQALERGPEYDVEFRALRLDGSLFWLQGQGRAIAKDGHATGMIGVVWDITRRKQEELDRQFLLDLSAKLAATSEVKRLVDITTAELRTYLNVTACSFGEVIFGEDAAAQIKIVSRYPVGGPSQRDTFQLSEFSSVAEELSPNRVVTVVDTETDPRIGKEYQAVYRASGVQAFLSVPLFHEGVWRASITVADNQSRCWLPRESALLCSVAERVWPVLENARLLQLMRERLT